MQIAQKISSVLILGDLHKYLIDILHKNAAHIALFATYAVLILIFFAMAYATHGATAARATTGAATLAFLLVSYHADYYRRKNSC